MFAPGDIEDNLTLINKGKADEAIGKLQQELAANPDNARAHELLALAYLRQTKLDPAGKEAEKAVSLGESASTRVTSARVAIARQNWAAATKDLDKAAQLDASHPEIALQRGSMALARKDYKTAVDTLNPYVSANPEEPYGHYYLGLAEYGLKRPDKTVSHFQRFLALAPDAPEAARVESLLRSIR
jgi:tetratricopeptide (TPR) repeat protein